MEPPLSVTHRLMGAPGCGLDRRGRLAFDVHDIRGFVLRSHLRIRGRFPMEFVTKHHRNPLAPAVRLDLSRAYRFLHSWRQKFLALTPGRYHLRIDLTNVALRIHVGPRPNRSVHMRLECILGILGRSQTFETRQSVAGWRLSGGLSVLSSRGYVGQQSRCGDTE